MSVDYQLLCSKCGKSLKNYQALISHEKWKHQQPKYHKCDVCTRSFRDSFTLKRHINGVHKTNGNSIPRNKTAACPLCDYKGAHTCMSEHFSVHHNIKLKMESLIFDHMTDFNEWKAGIEQETMSRYVKHRASRKNKDGTTIHHFYCHRDGHFSSMGKKIRSLKILGSNKINAHCPSFMKVTENSRITVEFSSTHVGHCGYIGRMTLSKAEKDKIANQIAMKVPLEDILNDIQNSAAAKSEFNCLHFTSRKDLHDIIEQFRLNKDTVNNKRKNVLPKSCSLINNSVGPNLEGLHEKDNFFLELTMPQNILELDQLKRIVKTIQDEPSQHAAKSFNEPFETIAQSIEAKETINDKSVPGASLELMIAKNVEKNYKQNFDIFSGTLMEPSIEVIVESTEIKIKDCVAMDRALTETLRDPIRQNIESGVGNDYDSAHSRPASRKPHKKEIYLQQKTVQLK